MKEWKPIFDSAKLEQGLEWGGPGFIYQEKKDGVWAEEYLPDGTVVVGEQCQDVFWAFDIPVFRGKDITDKPLVARLAILASLPMPSGWRLIPSGNGGEFLRNVLSAGGEGVVRKPIASRYGEGWVKCKRVETHDCVVVEKNPSKRSVRLAQSGVDCGWLTMPTVAAWNLSRPGAVVEVACHSRHQSGKFREPRLIRFRTDKTPAECRL